MDPKSPLDVYTYSCRSALDSCLLGSLCIHLPHTLCDLHLPHTLCDRRPRSGSAWTSSPSAHVEVSALP